MRRRGRESLAPGRLSRACVGQRQRCGRDAEAGAGEPRDLDPVPDRLPYHGAGDRAEAGKRPAQQREAWVLRQAKHDQAGYARTVTVWVVVDSCSVA